MHIAREFREIDYAKTAGNPFVIGPQEFKRR